MPVTRVPECPPLPPSPAPAPKAKKGDDRQLQQFYERWIGYNVYTGYKGLFGVLSHQLDSASPIKNSLRLDSLNFEVMITSIDPECVHLEVVIDSIFTKTFVHNCPGGGQGPNGTSRVGMKNEGKRGLQGGGITSVAGGYLLKVDLDSVASQLRSRPYGSLVNIELRVKTPGATVAFVNGTNAEDLRPRLNVYGEYRKISDRADYTIAYQHDDANLRTTVSAKIDDARHTMNDLASQGIGARRSSITNFFGADYRMLKTERTVVEADTTGMLMTRIDTARQVYTGLGAKRLVADAEGDSLVTNYDALNRPTEIINSDGTRSTIVYMQVRPDSLGLTDQEFYGYVDVKIVTNEIGVKNAQFSDAFGRLRREVADYGQGLSYHNLTTKYEYDLLGRLVEVINPKGQSTTYTHDEFGRVKTKTHPDLGTLSYAYDDLGNIRFAQDQQQADKGLLTYNQYDDLNRLVLIGEAYIDQTGMCGRYDEDHPDLGGCNSGSRLTDGLNGNKLHVASYQDVVDHLGSTRVVLDENGNVMGRSDNTPFGEALEVAGNRSRKGFIDKETDSETSTANHGVRQYDAITGTFRSPDAAWEKFPSLSPYQYSRNNPENRYDANGLWDITVCVDDDRTKNSGLGTAVLTDRDGNVQYVWQIRAQGQSQDRMSKTADGDTPTGVYDIDDKTPWFSGGSRQSYGPNPRLVLTAISGEIKKSGRTLIRMHGGRQEDPKTWKRNGKSLSELEETQGCIRAYDDDMKKLKEITDKLEANDSEEPPGVLIVTGQGLEHNYPEDSKPQPITAY